MAKVWSTEWLKDGGDGRNPELAGEELSDEEFMERVRGGKPNVIPDMRPYWSENMGHEPVLVKDRAHYRDLLKERGMECVDSGAPYIPPEEWKRRKSKRTFRFGEGGRR